MIFGKSANYHIFKQISAIAERTCEETEQSAVNPFFIQY